METILFLLVIAATVYAWRPRRATRHSAPPMARPALSVGRSTRRPPPPFWPALAGFLAQCVTSLRATGRAMATAIRMELAGAQPSRRRAITMSSAPQSQDLGLIDYTPSPVVLASVSGMELVSGIGIEPGIEQSNIIKAGRLTLNKGQVAAVKKWKSGATLTQSDVAALLGNQRAAAMDAIVEVTQTAD